MRRLRHGPLTFGVREGRPNRSPETTRRRPVAQRKCASGDIPFRCRQNKREPAKEPNAVWRLRNALCDSPVLSFRRPPCPPRRTKLRKAECFRAVKINANFCADHSPCPAQLCSPGGRGGAPEAQTGEKSVSVKNANILSLRIRICVYFDDTGTLSLLSHVPAALRSLRAPLFLDPCSGTSGPSAAGFYFLFLLTGTQMHAPPRDSRFQETHASPGTRR